MKHLHSRRAFLFGSAGTALALTLTACGGGSSTGSGGGTGDGAPETKDITVGVFPSFNGLGGAIANTSGKFTDKGLTPKVTTFATPAEATPQLLGGQVHFALMDMTVPILAASRGVPLVMVAPGTSGKIPEHSGDIGFVNLWVRKDSPFQSPKDLTDATVAVPQINSQIWQDVRAAIDADGGDSSKTKFMEAPNTIAALKAGQADATTTAEPGGTRTLTDGDLRPLAPIESAGGATAYAFVATRQFVTANPNTVKAFVDAIIEANKIANSDKAAAVAAAAALMNAPADLLDKAIFPTFVEEPVSQTDLTTAIERMQRYGLLTTDNAPKPEALLA
ncbi:MAG: ABC transporter substrate-binding protein [Propionibacteriaceae bacterium]|nr:ABC transporter substrate-binding protein [Propionibacteriaceae bacterium]